MDLQQVQKLKVVKMPRRLDLEQATKRVKQVKTEYFAALNPDLQLRTNPFPELWAGLAAGRIGVCAPEAWSPCGEVKDSAR